MISKATSLEFVTVFLAIVLAMGTASTCVAQSITYENHNQIDYGPLALSQIAGIAKDQNGVVISQVTVGLFTEKEHGLLAIAQTDPDGKFSSSRWRRVTTDWWQRAERFALRMFRSS